ncbi:hypothetical protein D5086_006198 [Populus alba]|uniref:Uncharacterized protein n=1 Tax=Populus alba TaxID=43335 RepID=A0ACC4CJT9_POPAL
MVDGTDPNPVRLSSSGPHKWDLLGDDRWDPLAVTCLRRVTPPPPFSCPLRTERSHFPIKQNKNGVHLSAWNHEG